MAEVGTENREWIKYLLLSTATYGAGMVARDRPSFVGVGTFDTLLNQVTSNLLQYLEFDGTRQVQAEALQLIAEDEAKTKAAQLVQKKEHAFGNTQIAIDPKSSAAATILASRERIAEDDLAGDGIEEDMHVTVRYGLTDDDHDRLRVFIASLQPFEARVGELEIFPASEHSDGACPIVARIISQELRAIEQAIGDYAAFKEKSFPDYKPHCTLAYVKVAAAQKYADLYVDGSFIVRSITISHQSGVMETIPFGMVKKFDEAQHPRDATGKFTASGGVTGLRSVLNDLLKPDGGFTYSLTTRTSPTDGFSLSLHKDREKVLDVKTLTLMDLDAFAKANSDLLRQSGNYFGAWHNPEDGKVYLDISTVVPEAAEAQRLGKLHDQIAYFDLAHFTSVPVQKQESYGEEETDAPLSGVEGGGTLRGRFNRFIQSIDWTRSFTGGNRGGVEETLAQKLEGGGNPYHDKLGLFTSKDGSSGVGLVRVGTAWQRTDGTSLSAADKARVAALKIPPAWTSVRLNPNPDEPMQAFGKDAKGRTQYRYSDTSKSQNAAKKFVRLKAFTASLPAIRAGIADGISRGIDAAYVLRLIDKSAFRIGGTEDTGAEKQAYGASTLLNKHVKVAGDIVTLTFSFTGKKGVHIRKTIKDAELADYIRTRQETLKPSDRIFTSNVEQVRSFLHDHGGPGLHPKDFRTHHGTAIALDEIAKSPVPKTAKAAKALRLKIATKVAAYLVNTPAVALSAYISPEVFKTWGALQVAQKHDDQLDLFDVLIKEFLETHSYVDEDVDWHEDDDEPAKKFNQYHDTHTGQFTSRDASPAQAGDLNGGGRIAVSEAPEGAHPTGQPFVTDTKGRPAANLTIQVEANAYNATHGLPSVDHSQYIAVDQTRAGRIADAYDALPMDDSANPEVRRSYEALAREVNDQWDAAVAHGMVFEPETSSTDAADKGPYQSSFDVTADIRDHRHLFFYTGGDPNQFMAQIDAKTGISINDKFRAIHDYYGHAAGGFGFGPRGEENAWAVHSQMFTPAARRALTTETRGQNSWVNFGRQNYDAQGNYKYIAPADRPYAAQKTALLPEEFAQLNYAQKWDESLHPRDEAGQFSDSSVDLPLGDYAQSILKDVARAGNWKLSLTKTGPGWGEDTHEYAIVPKTLPAGIQDSPSGLRDHVWFDPAFAEVTTNVDGRPQVTPKAGLLTDITEESEPGMLYRGLSFAEWEEAKRTGVVKSSGDYNLGETQRGLTYFSTDIAQAANYASGFAPWQYKPSFGRPAIVIKVQDPGNAHRTTETERGVPTEVRLADIRTVYEGHPYMIAPGGIDFYRNYTGPYNEGSRHSPSVWNVWKKTVQKFNETLHPRDEDGQFVTAYHGTDKAFDTFDPAHGGDTLTTNTGAANGVLGVFLTTDTGKADSYAGRRGRVIEAQLKLTKPLKLRGQEYDADASAAVNVAAADYHDKSTADLTEQDFHEWKDYLIRQGHDGIEVTLFPFRGKSEKDYVVFSSSQITAKKFDEALHPRDQEGKFTDGDPGYAVPGKPSGGPEWDAPWTPMFEVVGGPSHGSTVSAETLKERGILLHADWLKKKRVTKADVAGRYVTPFVNFDGGGEGQLQLIASLNSSRLATWGFTAEASMRGIKRYRLTAILDGRTSEFCRDIDGRIFDVEDARTKVVEALNVQDPNDLKTVQPWPKQTLAALAEFKAMSNDDLVGLGFHIPPYHPRCRTICRLVGNVQGDSPRPVPKLMSPERATQQTFKEMGVIATQAQVDHWNAHLGLSPIGLLMKLSGLAAREVLGGRQLGTRSVKFYPNGDIGARVRGVNGSVKYQIGTVLDPFTGTFYLSEAELVAGDAVGQAEFMQQLFSSMLEIGASSTATSVAVMVGTEGYHYAKLGFLPTMSGWQTIRLQALDAIVEGDLVEMFQSLSAEHRVVLQGILQDSDEHIVAALVALQISYQGKSIGAWILEKASGSFALDLTDTLALDQARAYLTTVAHK